MATRRAMTSTASAAPFVSIGPPGDLVEVVPDARRLPRALALDLGVRHGPGARPAERPAHQIRQRQARGARLGVPLGTLRVAGANLHPDGASGAHGVPLRCWGLPTISQRFLKRGGNPATRTDIRPHDPPPTVEAGSRSGFGAWRRRPRAGGPRRNAGRGHGRGRAREGRRTWPY